MTSVAVVAHSAKSIGGGLTELRAVLRREGVGDPLWYEVTKSRHAAKRVRDALHRGADLVLVWGGDGLVQRVVDVVAGLPPGERVPIGIIPAGTANVLADNLDIPGRIEAAVTVGLHGHRRAIDVGRM